MKKKTKLRSKSGASEMAQWVKTLAAKASRLSVSPRTHAMGGMNESMQVVL